MESDSQLVNAAREVLKQNDRGSWTVPSVKLYPHQWLWDSCFIALGLRHLNPPRAAAEVKSLFRGQWRNGMLPHITLTEQTNYWVGPEFWQSGIAADAPENIPTSGITQPPLPAIAAEAVAAKLPEPEALVFLRSIFPGLVAYHRWFYQQRHPDNSGLVTLVHPWETGLDDAPPWMEALKLMSPLWITAMLRLRLDRIVSHIRPDTKTVPINQRLTTTEALKLLHLAYRLKRYKYDSRVIIQKCRYNVQELSFNCILIRANKALQAIAATIAEDIPADLSYSFVQSEQALEQLWDEPSGQYFSRRYRDKQLIKVPTIATLLPLYSGVISTQRAAALVRLLKDPKHYATAFPVATVDIASKWYDEDRYWQGPTWLNMNWLIIRGLQQYGYIAEAERLRASSLGLVRKTGFYEYFSALNGSGYGSDCFSWTAAVAIDLECDWPGVVSAATSPPRTGPQ